MQDQIGSTQCHVRILTPNGTRLLFGSPQRGDTSPGEEAQTVCSGGIMTVDVDNDLAQACGGFTLVMEGRLDVSGRRWDQVIPMRSLVFITMERFGFSSLPDAEPTVMVGLTHDHSMEENYSEARFQRFVVIRG